MTETADGAALLSEIIELKRRAKQRRRDLIRSRECPVHKNDDTQPDPELKEIDAKLKAKIAELDAVIIETAISLSENCADVTIPDIQKLICGCTSTGAVTTTYKQAVRILFNARVGHVLRKNGFIPIGNTSRHVKYTYRGD